MKSVHVDLGPRSYDVLVGHRAIERIGELIPASAQRVAVITQDGLPFAELDFGVPHRRLVVGHGESHKTLATIERLCRSFAEFGLTRHDCVVGVGGGMITDLAGFAAASWHRGIPVVHVATSLLAMVDAAVGGKTGVNLPEGKNLVGAFWQPSGVICDLDALASLPEREQRCGRGEMAKYHFLTGDDFTEMDLAERVARSVQIKAEIVGEDERESGRRAVLNYGHTLAHALETATDHQLAHGEAVAIGLVYAARLAHRLGRISAQRVDEHDRVVAEDYGLSTALHAGVDPNQLIELIGRDKKVLGRGLTFVLDGPDGVDVVDGVPVDAVADALASMPAS